MFLCLLLCLVQLTRLLLQADCLFPLNFESSSLIFLGVSLLLAWFLFLVLAMIS